MDNFSKVPSKGPQNITVRRDPEDATVLVVSWEPLTIVEAHGFITYEVVATPSSGSRKRQQQILRASVPYNVNTIRLTGTDPAVFYTIIVAVCSKSVNSRRLTSVASSRQMSGASRPASTNSEGEFDISTYTCPAYAPTVPKNNIIQGEYIIFRKKSDIKTF